MLCVVLHAPTGWFEVLTWSVAGESDAPQGVVNTSDGRVVRAFHRFTLVDQTGQGRDLTKGRRRDQVNEQVLPLPTCCLSCLFLPISANPPWYKVPCSMRFTDPCSAHMQVR